MPEYTKEELKIEFPLVQNQNAIVSSKLEEGPHPDLDDIDNLDELPEEIQAQIKYRPRQEVIAFVNGESLEVVGKRVHFFLLALNMHQTFLYLVKRANRDIENLLRRFDDLKGRQLEDLEGDYLRPLRELRLMIARVLS